MSRKPTLFALLVLTASGFAVAASPDVTGSLPRDFVNPAEMPGADWSEDILVTSRDSVVQVILDRAANGNLFCCYRFLGDGEVAGWGVAMSTDGGASWTETAVVQYDDAVPDVGMACIGEFVYIGCIRGGAVTYRLSTTTGLRVPFHSGGTQIYFDSSANIAEIEVMAGVGTRPTRVYFALMDSSGWLRVKDIDTTGYFSWEWARRFRDGSRGLSLSANPGGSFGDALMSYIDTLDRVRVYGLISDTCAIFPKYTGSQVSNGDYTSVSGWHDTLIVFFDCQSGNRQARYQTSYNGGTNWVWGFVGDTTASFTRSAAVTGGGGMGQGVVFWQYPQGDYGVSFTWRDYGGPWSAPVGIHDYPSISDRLNAIEHLGAGQYGIVYFRGTQNGMAYFDRSDWTGVSSQRGAVASVRSQPLCTVLRNVLRLRGASSAMLVDQAGRLVLDLHAGENDIRQLSPGVYFVRQRRSSGQAAEWSSDRVVITK